MYFLESDLAFLRYSDKWFSTDDIGKLCIVEMPTFNYRNADFLNCRNSDWLNCINADFLKLRNSDFPKISPSHWAHLTNACVKLPVRFVIKLKPGGGVLPLLLWRVSRGWITQNARLVTSLLPYPAYVTTVVTYPGYGSIIGYVREKEDCPKSRSSLTF